MPTLAVLEAGQLKELTPLSDRMFLARQAHTGSTVHATDSSRLSRNKIMWQPTGLSCLLTTGF